MMGWKRNVASPRIAIIGAGFAGIAAGVRLRKAGITTFTIFERSAHVGGTWWDNRYPGAEVDTPSVLYSYSFAPARWSRTHVRQAELLEYLDGIVDSYGLRDHVQLETEVSRVEWNEAAQRHAVDFADGSRQRFDLVISAVGLLNDPRYPDWPGMESFRGKKFHTSRWDASTDLAGKTVAVVGSGSTAAQVVPAVAETAGKVLMFQREPGWLLPKGGREFAPNELEALGSATAQRIVRWLMLYRRERSQYKNAAWRPGTHQNIAAESAARAYINETFADRPDLREAVTPSYPYGGKRPILTDDLYPSLLRDNVELVPHAVTGMTEHGIVDARGVQHDVDVLVMSTGFKSEFISTFEVVGRDGRMLHEVWNGEPQALLGILTPGFPNFFMMYGPNTNGGAIVTHLESQAAYITSAVRHIASGRATSIEVRESASAAFNYILQRRLAGTSFQTANNYYKSAAGRVVTQWSDGAIAYGALTKLLRRVAWKTSKVVTGTGVAAAVSAGGGLPVTVSRPPRPSAPADPRDDDLEKLLVETGAGTSK